MDLTSYCVQIPWKGTQTRWGLLILRTKSSSSLTQALHECPRHEGRGTAFRFLLDKKPSYCFHIPTVLITGKLSCFHELV